MTPRRLHIPGNWMAVLAWLAANGVEPDDLFVYGESLGTGAATAMASELSANGTPVPATHRAHSGKNVSA